MGAKLVDGLEGTPGAKDRLRAILSTITGECSVPEAARSIDCHEANLYVLRGRMLQEAVQGLEPRTPGRKPKVRDEKDEEIERLRHELEKVKAALATVSVRLDLATSGVTPRQKRRRRTPRS